MTTVCINAICSSMAHLLRSHPKGVNKGVHAPESCQPMVCKAGMRTTKMQIVSETIGKRVTSMHNDGMRSQGCQAAKADVSIDPRERTLVQLSAQPHRDGGRAAALTAMEQT